MSGSSAVAEYHVGVQISIARASGVSPCRVLPFRFGRQAPADGRAVIHCVVPGYAFNRQLIASVAAGIATRHMLVRGLCHFRSAKPEGLCDPGSMRRLLVLVTFGIAFGTTHRETAGRDQDVNLSVLGVERTANRRGIAWGAAGYSRGSGCGGNLSNRRRRRVNGLVSFSLYEADLPGGIYWPIAFDGRPELPIRKIASKQLCRRGRPVNRMNVLHRAGRIDGEFKSCAFVQILREGLGMAPSSTTGGVAPAASVNFIGPSTRLHMPLVLKQS